MPGMARRLLLGRGGRTEPRQAGADRGERGKARHHRLQRDGVGSGEGNQTAAHRGHGVDHTSARRQGPCALRPGSRCGCLHLLRVPPYNHGIGPRRRPRCPTIRAGAKPAPVTIRAREPGDWQEIADLTSLPNVRFGTLRLPFTSGDHWRRLMEKPGDGVTSIVAVLDAASSGRRSHPGQGAPQPRRRNLHVGARRPCGRGIGTALLAALVDAADNWLNIRRLELTVYVDNEPGIRLYKKFGFEIEGTRRADAFRAGKFVDSLMMARVLPG